MGLYRFAKNRLQNQEKIEKNQKYIWHFITTERTILNLKIFGTFKNSTMFFNLKKDLVACTFTVFFQLPC